MLTPEEKRILRNKRLREYRRMNGHAATFLYEKTPNGFLMRMYRNMKSRILGIQKMKYHLYRDKELLSKEDFYIWAKNNKQFHVLFKTWVQSDHDRKLTPSVDRIDSKLGYSISNMEWVTHSENSRRGSISNGGKALLGRTWEIVNGKRRYSPNLRETVRSMQ